MSKTNDIRRHNAEDELLSGGVEGDVANRVEVRADGTIWTGDGTAPPDTQLASSPPADPPLITSGEPTDGDFDETPPNGTIAIDGDTDVAYYRKAGVWTAIGAPAAPTEPGAPTIGVATAGDGTATINWTAGTTGGSPITGNEVTLYLDADDTVVDTQTVGAVLTYQFTGLTNGADVYGKVAAINAIDTGPQSAASNVVTPDVPPPFDPASLGSKLKVWLEGEDLLVGAISSWASRSPATFNATQGTGAAQPAGVAAQLNGFTIARFDGTNDFLTLGTAKILGEEAGDSFTVLYVKKIIASGPPHAILARDDNALGRSFNIYKNNTNSPSEEIAGTAGWNSSGGNDNWSYETVDSIAGGTHQGWRDGVLSFTGSGFAVGTGATGPTDIGRRSYSGAESYAHMDLAAMYICVPQLTGPEIASMHAYIADRFAL